MPLPGHAHLHVRTKARTLTDPCTLSELDIARTRP